MIGITDLYFKRKMRERGEFPDIYQYDELPQKLKVQIVLIWRENFGDYEVGIYGNIANAEYYDSIYSILCKELAVFHLMDKKRYSNTANEIFDYFLYTPDTDIALSIIEIMFQYMTLFFEKNYRRGIGKVISELNQRFKEHGVGYQYENGQIIRIDSQFIHTEAVKPTLTLLSNPKYHGAQQEFLRAHEHYRHQRYQEAMVDCLKAYESTLKIILKHRGWNCDRDTAKPLTDTAMKNGLIPEYWQSYFQSLTNTLTSGVPTARNKEAGHGQADELKNVPDYLVSYILHMTASAILFLIQADEALP